MTKFFIFALFVFLFLHGCSLSNSSDMVTNLNGSSIRVDSVFSLFDSLLLKERNNSLDNSSGGKLNVLDSVKYFRNFFFGLINETQDRVNRDFLLIENIHLSRYNATLVLFNTKDEMNLFCYNSKDNEIDSFSCFEREEFYYNYYCVRPTFPPNLKYSKVVSSKRIKSAFLFSRFSRYPSEITSNIIFNHNEILDTLRKSNLLDTLDGANFDYHVLYVILSDFENFPVPAGTNPAK